MPYSFKRSAVRAAVLVCALVPVVTLAPAASAAPASVSNTGFTYAGTWGSVSGENYSKEIGATATLKFTIDASGGTVSLRSVKNSNNGYAGVSIDGGSETQADLYSLSQVNNTPVYTSPTLTAGQHTMKVRVTGNKASLSKNTFVSVTGADVSNGSFGATTVPPTTPAAAPS